MRISIGADHAGFEQKEHIKEYLSNKGYEVLDRGCQGTASVDYPDFAASVGGDVASGLADFGVLICGTGIGMSIAANKVRGVRAALVLRPDFAELSRAHNNANVICLSGRFVSVEENEKLLDIFLDTEFSGGHHQPRIDKISALDEAR